MWLKDLPIKDTTLYDVLKSQGVFITPGSIFFQGLNKEEEWNHKYECTRLSLTANEQDLRQGIKVLSTVINATYK